MGTDTDTLIGVAQALEQKRALVIVADIAAMGDFFTESDAFRAGWDSACEEITERLRTEVWPGCLPPIDAAKTLEANAGPCPELKA